MSPMIPIPPPDQWDDIITAFGGVLAALAALVGALWSGYRTRIEVREMRGKLDSETSPDHGSSLRDSVDRIEARIGEMRDTQRGMARDIGRLGSADQRIEQTADHIHEDIRRRLERLEDTRSR
ncbi:hypothetical protein [Acidipropionibacterium timonense]|uniref:hypothetical protein n=1 Tax=Acidipropionibacterium timonense TaxID=2161818 RepID=UPI001AEC2265|nr:hypothetical protein [Acidipropionibacterium timonense]